MPNTRETVGNVTTVKNDAGEVIHTIERTFAGGKMTVTRDGKVVREVEAAQLQKQIDNVEDRIAQMTANKTMIEGFLAQANASA